MAARAELSLRHLGTAHRITQDVRRYAEEHELTFGKPDCSGNA